MSLTRSTDLPSPRGRGWGWGMEWEVGVRRCKLQCMGGTNEILCCGIESQIQCPMINRNGKEQKKECVYIYI